MTDAPMEPEYEATPAAVRALLDAFWTPAGWRGKAEPAALSIAVEAGLGFGQARTRSHDEWITAARQAVRAISLREVGEEFVSSLLTRRLDLRSALGSYAVARHLEPHAYAGRGADPCRVCGLYEDVTEDLSLLNFERFKWGGVRREDIAYVAFDLEQFRRAPAGDGDQDEALAVGRQLLSALRTADADATVVKLATELRMVKGNKAERAVLLEVLGVCGVLRTPGHPSFRTQFVPDDCRELPPQHNVETAYPACWWRGRDGLDDDALSELLPLLA